MTRDYPDTVAGPYEPPPRTFTDRADRELTVRVYGEGPGDDLEALVEMYEGYDPEDRAQGIPPAGEERIRSWLDTITDDDCYNVVAWHDDWPAGHATLVPDRGGAYELAIFVDSDYQNAGIGTQLIEGLLGHGHDIGIERVWLTVERWNEPAISLYHKVGFERTGDGSFELEMTARLREE
ncbi:GNAT family N-acetyltransferase [Haloglomus halophilum]|uniref:GNAT family N-acetyltransferase n=1 Tax=Haloglomus halophilum TaxID=2962672 RepID=UPI0020C9F32C|nr:GNAT family N-acetyltransferase [Haloglomus halophilum]